jgi:hypothetical protein
VGTKSVFLEKQRFYFSIAQGQERRDLAVREARLQSQAETFDRIASDPASAIRKYEVRYLVVCRSYIKAEDWSGLENCADRGVADLGAVDPLIRQPVPPAILACAVPELFWQEADSQSK